MIFLLADNCYQQFDENGCFDCVSRDNKTKCGYCLNSLSCTPSNKCNNHIISDNYCSNEICQLYKSYVECKSPCKWSFSKGCIHQINYERKYNVVLRVGLMMLCAVVVVFVLMCAICYIAYDHKPEYEYLLLNNSVDTKSLDEIPNIDKYGYSYGYEMSE